MNEEEKVEEPGYESSAEAWREVGQHFQTFGASLAAAFRTAWQDEVGQERLREVGQDLKSVANDLGRAIDQALDSTEAQRAREEVEAVSRSAHEAAQKSWEESKPHVTAALNQVSAELEEMSARLRRATPPEEEETPPTE